MTIVNRPEPQPTIDDIGFWEGIEQRRLHFQYCSDCSHYNHPPLPVCPYCQGHNLSWQEPNETPYLFSFTNTHVAPHPALATSLPITIAVIRYPHANIQFISNFSGVAKVDAIDQELVLCWSNKETSKPLPFFTLKEVSAG